MSTEENIWESRYQEGVTRWDRGSSSANLSYWLDKQLLKPCRVLIPGCGNGYEVLTLAKLGFEVVAIDVAPTAIENLRSILDKENINAELVLGDFFTWNPEVKFDAIFEQTSLCALPPKEWKQYESKLSDWLKPQGKLFAQFLQTEREGGPPFHCELSEMYALFNQEKWAWSEGYTTQEKELGIAELLYLLVKIG